MMSNSVYVPTGCFPSVAKLAGTVGTFYTHTKTHTHKQTHFIKQHFNILEIKATNCAFDLKIAAQMWTLPHVFTK